MAGKIECRRKCQCGGTTYYRLNQERGLRCKSCHFPAPGPFSIVFWYKGKARRVSCDTEGNPLPTWDHAELASKEIASQIERGQFFPEEWRSRRANRYLWGNYLDDYLARESRRCTRATWDKKRSQAAHLRAAFEGRNIRDITAAMIEDWANSLDMAPKSKQDLLGELRHILRQAERREDIQRVPHVPSVKVVQQPIDWLLPEEQAAAFEKMPRVHQPIFATLFYYGMRPGEVCAAMWDQVNIAAKTFTVSRTYSRRVIVDRTKTGRPNVLPLAGPLAEWCDTVRGFPETPIFRNPAAVNPLGAYTPDFLNAVWKRVRPREIRLYNAARHSKGMQALNLDGWTVDELQRLFGHTSPQHTKKYAEMGVERVRESLTRSLPSAKGKGVTGGDG